MHCVSSIMQTSSFAETSARYFLRCKGPSCSFPTGLGWYIISATCSGWDHKYHLLLSLFCSVSFIIKRLRLTSTNMTLTKCPTYESSCAKNNSHPSWKCNTSWSSAQQFVKGWGLAKRWSLEIGVTQLVTCFIIINSPWAAGRVLWCCTACGNSHRHWVYSKETTLKDKRSKETHRKSIKHQWF